MFPCRKPSAQNRFGSSHDQAVTPLPRPKRSATHSNISTRKVDFGIEPDTMTGIEFQNGGKLIISDMRRV
jgi:hypothetical protein